MPPHKNKFIPIHKLKPSSFRPPPTKHVNSDLYTEVKLISIPTKKSSKFWCHDTKAKLFRIPTQTNFSSTPTLKRIHFLTPHKIQVHFDTHT